MINPDALFAAYIDINILLALALLFWVCCRVLLSLSGRGAAFEMPKSPHGGW